MTEQAADHLSRMERMERKIDAGLKLSQSTQTSMTRLEGKVDTHLALDQQASEHRAATCPHNGTIAQHGADLNAVAGKVREIEGNVQGLQLWRQDAEEDHVVEGVYKTQLKAFFREVAKITLAVATALAVMGALSKCTGG